MSGATPGGGEHREGDWWEGYFDQHFLELYQPFLTPEVSGAEAEAVAELLSLEPGARVLDVGCGWGRHSLLLAREGMEVTGVDLSPALLREARRRGEEEGIPVRWLQRDMRALGFDGEFDAALSLFSSLGYFRDPADDLRVLRGMRRALRSDGLLLMECMHRDHVVRHFAERDWWEGPGGDPVWVERQFDPVEGVSREWLRWSARGEIQEKYHEIRVRTATEWAGLLAAAGLQVVGWYGGWEADELSPDSERLIVVARPA